jgi:hypothetical protein
LSDVTDEIVDAGVLYDVVGTNAAPVTSELPYTTNKPVPGAFHLEALNMRNGQKLIDRPLPAWNSNPDATLASLQNPPGVVGDADGTVLVSPDQDEPTPSRPFRAPPLPRCDSGKQDPILRSEQRR